MSNRHVEELGQVYTAIFADAVYAYPTLAAEFARDLARLLESSCERGLHVYVADLPAAGKHLDRCLSAGQYKLSGLPLTKRVSKRVVIPRFLRGLHLLVFHDDGRLKEDCDEQAVFFLRQIYYAAKKTTVPCSAEKVVDAVRNLISADSELPEPEMVWERSDVGPDDFSLYEGFSRSQQIRDRVFNVIEPQMRFDLTAFLAKLDVVSGIVSSSLGPYDPSCWKFRHGPGAISEVTGPTNKYDWYAWPDRLENAYPIADYGYHSYSSWACNVGSVDVGSAEPASRLVAVPKTYKAPRLIAAEPASHQWCQQNIWHYFRERAQSTWVNKFVRFRDQTYNQELCVKGSRDSSLATLDLKEASDRVTCHVVGQLFRGNPTLLLALQACRTRVVTQTLDPNSPERVSLRKFSTMGSACTFPVQSLVFLSIALSCVLTVRRMSASRHNIEKLAGEVAVFGDDLIVPSDSRMLLCEALGVLYFKVNNDKSFWNGNFRESCGVDAFRGCIVTPAYWHSPCTKQPESIASSVETANNFQKKWMLNTANYIASTMPRGINIPTVSMETGVFGLRSFVNPGVPFFKKRFNRTLQRDEILLPTLSAKVAKSPTDDDSALLQYFTEAPSPYDNWVHGVAQRPKPKIRLRWVPVSDLA